MYPSNMEGIIQLAYLHLDYACSSARYAILAPPGPGNPWVPKGPDGSYDGVDPQWQTERSQGLNPLLISDANVRALM